MWLQSSDPLFEAIDSLFETGSSFGSHRGRSFEEREPLDDNFERGVCGHGVMFKPFQADDGLIEPRVSLVESRVGGRLLLSKASDPCLDSAENLDRHVVPVHPLGLAPR